jgi:hypothetical protein
LITIQLHINIIIHIFEDTNFFFPKEIIFLSNILVFLIFNKYLKIFFYLMHNFILFDKIRDYPILKTNHDKQ